MKQTVRTAVYDESLQIEAYRCKEPSGPFPTIFTGIMSSDLLSLAPGGFPADSRHIFSGRVPFFCSILGIATPVPSVGRRC